MGDTRYSFSGKFHTVRLVQRVYNFYYLLMTDYWRSKWYKQNLKLQLLISTPHWRTVIFDSLTVKIQICGKQTPLKVDPVSHLSELSLISADNTHT